MTKCLTINFHLKSHKQKGGGEGAAASAAFFLHFLSAGRVRPSLIVELKRYFVFLMHSMVWLIIYGDIRELGRCTQCIHGMYYNKARVLRDVYM